MARADYHITPGSHSGPPLFCPGIKGGLTITDLTPDHVKGSFAFTCFESMNEAVTHEVRGTFDTPLIMGAGHSPEGNSASGS